METNGFMVCSDCFDEAVGLFDDTAAHYGYGEEHVAVIRGAVARLRAENGDLSSGDPERDDEFSWRPCDCCGSRLGGVRQHVVALQSEPPWTVVYFLGSEFVGWQFYNCQAANETEAEQQLLGEVVNATVVSVSAGRFTEPPF